MMFHVMVCQVKTLWHLPRGLQRNGRATMKTEVRYSSATVLVTYQTTQNIAMWASVSGMFSSSHRNFPFCSSVEIKFVYQTKTWLVLNTKHRLSGLWHRVVWQAGSLPMIQRSLDFMLPFSCTDNTVKTLQAPFNMCLQSMHMTFLTSYSLFRTADLTFTAFKSAALITVTAKCLIKSKARDNDSIRSSFHSTVTASAAGFLHSPLSAVTVPRLYTLHTNPSSWTDTARGLLTCHRWFQAPSSRQRPLLP